MAFADSTPKYNLTIDCFPLGFFAAIEVAGKIKTLLSLAENNEHIPSLTERTYFAVEKAYEYAGTPPRKITVVCLDDGGDGSELKDLQHVFNCSVDQGMMDAPSHEERSASLESAQRVRHSALRQLTP